MDEDLYLISMAARLLGLDPQTLRKVERLRVIKRLVDDGGINLAGVQRLLSIAKIVQRIRPLMREDALSGRESRRRLSQELDELLKMLEFEEAMDFKDYYSTLGVAKTATEKELKQAYRKLARKHHPDVNPGDKSAETRFKEINEAYEVLGDPSKRKKYDELGANWRQYEQAGAGAGFDPRQAGGAYNVYGGGPGAQGGGFRTMTEDEMRDLFGDANPFSDFFQTFFGGAAGPGGDEPGRRTRGARSRARAGRDAEQELDLGLEDAYHGTMRRLSISHD